MLRSFITPLTDSILNEAISQELYASQLHRHIANQCQRLGLFGAQKYFKSESASELEHYQKIVDYINDRGTVAETPEIPAIDLKITTLNDAIQEAYNAELELGDKYNEWYKEVVMDDPTTAQFLLQFIEIQRKSIGEIGDLLSRLQLVGDDKCGILIIDKELGGI